ncbi:pimeloyl-CoA dehydrogenase small subunit [Marinobacter sp. NP-4(2019)]|uniref:acyl-CoA dehydrogenase family protein n=1 Tax=Marinobacter sp. NP-4(2019) TaxID=2488665 RepID=UPI000FC3C971|nr:acyl-CoA dehydrogenase [Marinobacter sp. NP-4(2019)]AZT85597.1 pimeloyl-CoA dehydrogenase small subunit [Marinobacter sp. NP-4(2019)]
MNFNLTEEQQMLNDSLRRFVTNEYDFEKRGKVIAAGKGTDPATWAALAEMGLLAFSFPEEYDGLGGNAIDTMVVMENFGRGLVVEPYLATVVLAGSVIRDHGSDTQKSGILPAIANGKRLMAFAHSEPGARYNLSHVQTTAKQDGSNYLISGHKTAVLHGGQADQLIVSARTSGGTNDESGLSLFLVDTGAKGVQVDDFATHDGHRTAEIRFSNVTVSADNLIGTIDQAFPAIEKTVDLGIAALCAEAVGAMEAMNAATLEYIKTRKQFGVPIGKFQVLQHRMADMFIQTEQAKTMAILAASEADSNDRASRREAISMAKTLVGQAARYVGQEGVQLHGGMGVTDEMFAAHLFKRLTLINLLFGDADHHLAQVSDGLLAKTA